MREIIQNYIDYNYKIIQLNGKIPIQKDWPNSGSQDIEKITRWLENGFNIGILTGKSSGVVVLDVDGEEGKNSLSSLGQSIETFIVSTGKGYHYYFKTNKALKNRVGILPGLDFRAEGGQVVAPPSIHPQTKMQYEIISHIEPAELPEWLEDLLKEKPIKTKEISGNSPLLTQIEGKQIPEGQRNNTLFLIGCSMRGAGAGIAAIVEHLSEVNNSLCVPPLDSKEVNNIATQASNYQKGKMPGDYTSIFCGADEVDISIPGKIYEFLRKKPANDFSRSLVVYTALRQISLLNSQEKIYNYTGYIADNYGTRERYIPAIIREFNDLSILTVHEKNTENGKYVQREIEFHPSQFDGGQNE